MTHTRRTLGGLITTFALAGLVLSQPAAAANNAGKNVARSPRRRTLKPGPANVTRVRQPAKQTQNAKSNKGRAEQLKALLK